MAYSRKARLLLATVVLSGAAGLGWAWQNNAFRAGPAIDYSGPVAGWDTWGGNAGGSRFSPLTQITPENVWALKPAWTYHIGMPEIRKKNSATFQTTPIIADNRMYLCSGSGKIVALEPETGKEIWATAIKSDNFSTYMQNCKGVTFARDAQAKPGEACETRIFSGTLDGRMVALDAATGRLCPSFGEKGILDLKAGLGKTERGDLAIASPPVVIGNNIVVNGRIPDNVRLDTPSGAIRAFDVHSGQPVWAFNALPPGMSDAKDAPQGEQFVRATPDSWAPMSVDPDLNLIFVPMGNAAPDHYGPDRKGLDYYASALVALDAKTGAVRWTFHTVHHDLWDYDLPSQPTLFDWPGS